MGGGWEAIALVGGQIILEGIKFLNEKDQRWAQDEYHDCMADLDRARALKFPFYSSVRVIIARRRLKRFLEAYHAKIKSVPAPAPVQ